MTRRRRKVVARTARAAKARRLASARLMGERYGARALSVAFGLKASARSPAQRRHWRNVVRVLEGRRSNPAARVKLADVKRAEREYASSVSTWGERNQATLNAMVRWYELRDQWAAQKAAKAARTANPSAAIGDISSSSNALGRAWSSASHAELTPIEGGAALRVRLSWSDGAWLTFIADEPAEARRKLAAWGFR